MIPPIRGISMMEMPSELERCQKIDQHPHRDCNPYKYSLLTMASDLPAVSQEHKTGNDSATGAQNEDISSSSPTAIPQTEPDESHDYASSTSKSSTSAENRLRPAAGIAFSSHFASTLIDETEYRRH